jgi:hypothetical protein
MSGIAVTAKYFPLNFLCVIFKPIVQIDGQTHEGSWGTSHFPAAPGDHQLTVFWKYLWFLPCNKGRTTVRVVEGQTTHVAYKAPWLWILPGKMSVAQASQAAA